MAQRKRSHYSLSHPGFDSNIWLMVKSRSTGGMSSHYFDEAKNLLAGLKTPPKNSISELWRSFSFLLSFEQTELESLIWDLVSQKSKQMFGRVVWVGRMQRSERKFRRCSRKYFSRSSFVFGVHLPRTRRLIKIIPLTIIKWTNHATRWSFKYKLTKFSLEKILCFLGFEPATFLPACNYFPYRDLHISDQLLFPYWLSLHRGTLQSTLKPLL